MIESAALERLNLYRIDDGYRSWNEFESLFVVIQMMASYKYALHHIRNHIRKWIRCS